MGGLAVFGMPLAWRTIQGLFRGRFAADVVAALAILTALALREPFAGLVIVLMQSGGEALETWAAGQASAAVRSLEAAAPRIAHRLDTDAKPQDVPVEEIRPGDRLLVRAGETVPCDSLVAEGRGEINTSRLTGEPWPVPVGPGKAVSSGVVVLDVPLVLEATARASDSQYARLVEMVREAQGSKAKLQRIADRWAVWFTPLVIVVAAGAAITARDPLRALAVLVVATPCPMLLAVPVAIVGGINRAARHGVIVRRGEALERLAVADTLIVDKTGTLTEGRPTLIAADPAPGVTRLQLLSAAAAVEESSGHLLARAVVSAARAEQIETEPATDVRDIPGLGVRGVVGGHLVRVGNSRWLMAELPDLGTIPSNGDDPTEMRAHVTEGSRFLGVLRFADRIRPSAAPALLALRQLGLDRQILASGDSTAPVLVVARAVGITDARGEQKAEDKAALVKAQQADGRRVLMLGDGTNDAPALMLADAGLAVAADGGGLGAASADAVLLSGDLSQVTAAVRIARRTLRIAQQSLLMGLGLSIIGMGFAAAGMLAPTVGALVQEAIDVAAILNALRAALPIASDALAADLPSLSSTST